MVSTWVRLARTCFVQRVAMATMAPLALVVVCSQWQLVSARLGNLFMPAGSIFSALSLACALAIAASTIVLRRRRPERRLTLRFLRRALFPVRLFRAASTRADLGYFVLNGIFTGSLIGAAMLSFHIVEQGVASGLTALFGPPGEVAVGPRAAWLQTGIFFLAFELAYYIDHYTSHRFDVFWQIHRVHHTAEVLTPLTLFRVHPLEALKYHNIVVVVTGFTVAVASRWLGPTAWTLNGTNILLVFFYLSLNHLQHSHMWIAFTGVLGRVLGSPAHHQMHHSDAPEHARCNFGWSLMVFDWLFGTLVVPGKRPEGLRFGVASGPVDHHTVAGGLVMPVIRALRTLGPARLAEETGPMRARVSPPPAGSPFSTAAPRPSTSH